MFQGLENRGIAVTQLCILANQSYRTGLQHPLIPDNERKCGLNVHKENKHFIISTGSPNDHKLELIWVSLLLYYCFKPWRNTFLVLLIKVLVALLQLILLLSLSSTNWPISGGRICGTLKRNLLLSFLPPMGGFF